MRTNVYKTKIVDVLKSKHLVRLADIQKEIPEADYSTLCRNIDQLVSEGAVRKVVFDKSSVMYETCDSDHDHDHFYCTDCGAVETLDCSLRDNVVGNKNKVHDIVVRGQCNECSE